jgi:hypothetical protein
MPAAGICTDPSPGGVATFQLNADTPQPRCGKVLADQQLRVVNATSMAITLVLAGIDYEVPLGGEMTFTSTFGDIWQAGVHVLHTSFYGASGPEIWLVTAGSGT